MNTFTDSFNVKYNVPYIPKKTVGFSGIDPSIPCDGEGGVGLSEDEINALIALYVSNLQIRIDSGRIDPDADEPIVPTVDLKTKDIPHNALDGLQGGQNGEYYHLTAAEYDKLKDYPLYSILRASLLHEPLPDLLGGDANGHYHLTNDELDNLRKLIAALISGGTVVLPSGGGTDDHEQLQNLLGGDANGHYHITDDEWTKLKALIAATFPPGSTTPVVPITPDNPDDPADDQDQETDAGLPPSEPPSWGLVGMPEANKTYAGAGNMYYGTIAENKSPYWFEALVVPTTYTATSITARRVRYTTDLSTWDDLYGSVTISTYGERLTQCLYVDFNDVSVDKDGNKYSFLIFYPSTAANIKYSKKSGTGIIGSLAQPKSLVAMAYSKTLRIAILVTDTGTVSMLKGPAKTTSTTLVKPKTTYDSKIGSVNFGSAVWLEAPKRFCVSGKDGVSFSSMGENWTKKTGDGKNVPIDLRGLTFRSDIEYQDNNGQTYIGCAFGWSGSDRTFWKSYDGEHWMRHNARPIPLADVKSVAYSPDYGMYCAVGTPQTSESGLYVYLSKDLAGWRKSKVSGDTMGVESVVWMASAKKFVLYPSGGSYLYTFDPKGWK